MKEPRRCSICGRAAKWIIALIDEVFYVCGTHRRAYAPWVQYRLYDETP